MEPFRVRQPGNRQGDSIQGWKLHVGCAPDQIETLFRVTSPVLTNVSHKYCPFEEYQSQADQV